MKSNNENPIAPEQEIETDKNLNHKILIKYVYGFFIYISIFLLSVWFISRGRGIYSSKTNLIFFSIMSLFAIISIIVLTVLLLRQDKRKITKRRFEILDLIHFFMLAISLLFFLQIFAFTITEVEGNSMEPTLHTKDKVVVTQISFSYKYDNIVVLRANGYAVNNPEDYFVKRIKAVSGDKIHYIEEEEGFVTKVIIYVNNKKLFEAPEQAKENWKQWIDETDGTIPKNMYILIGDNVASYDSKMFGFVNKKDILGKVRFRFYKEFGAIK